jgi:hypothetical protein
MLAVSPLSGLSEPITAVFSRAADATLSVVATQADATVHRQWKKEL